jgi:hypothetical protein
VERERPRGFDSQSSTGCGTPSTKRILARLEDAQPKSACCISQPDAINFDAELGEILIAGMHHRLGKIHLTVRFTFVVTDWAGRAGRSPTIAATDKA